MEGVKASSGLWKEKSLSVAIRGSSSLMEDGRKVTSDTTVVDDFELSNLLAGMCAPCGQKPSKQSKPEVPDADTNIISSMMEREPIYEREFLAQLGPQGWIYTVDPRQLNPFYNSAFFDD